MPYCFFPDKLILENVSLKSWSWNYEHKGCSNDYHSTHLWHIFNVLWANPYKILECLCSNWVTCRVDAHKPTICPTPDIHDAFTSRVTINKKTLKPGKLNLDLPGFVTCPFITWESMHDHLLPVHKEEKKSSVWLQFQFHWHK